MLPYFCAKEIIFKNYPAAAKGAKSTMLEIPIILHRDPFDIAIPVDYHS
jgi:hypothetical protein